jgi:uncharacterized protein YjbI with pentapeptide repeats
MPISKDDTWKKLIKYGVVHGEMPSGNWDLTAVDLQNADLTEADLQGADLSSANLSGASLIKANLTGAILFNAKLNRVCLIDSVLIHPKWRGLILAKQILAAAFSVMQTLVGQT